MFRYYLRSADFFCRSKSVLALLVAAFVLPAPSQTPAKPIVLQDVRLIDGTGSAPRNHVQIVIEDGKISQVRSSLLKIALPPGAIVLNLAGKTVMPGLINGHGHLGLVQGISVSPDNYTRDNIAHQLAQYERYGVTTMISLGMNKDLLYQLRADQEKGNLNGATILTADRGIGVPDGMPPVKVGPDQLYRPKNPEQARKAVDEMAERDPNLVKIWVDSNLGKLSKMKPTIYASVIDEAHKQKLRVAAHVYYLEDAKKLLQDDVDVLAHSIRDQAIDADTTSLIKNKDTFYIPTLQLEESFYIYADRPQWMSTRFFKRAVSPPLAKLLASPDYASKIKGDKATTVHREALRTAMANLKKLSAAGAEIGFGTDSGANPYRIQGFAEHRELELMVEAGLTPLQAIHSATAVNARMLHISEKTGTVEKGKSADLLVLNADPSRDIKNTQKISMVFHAGKRVNLLKAQ